MSDGRRNREICGRFRSFRFWLCSKRWFARNVLRSRGVFTPCFNPMALLPTLLARGLAVVGLVLLAPVLAVIFPFWLVSALTRGISRLLEPRFLTREQLIQFDPVFGWRSRPNLDTHHLMVDLFHLRTDQDGWRGPGTLDQSDLVVF